MMPLTNEQADKVGTARIVYKGMKPYGWLWNRVYQPTWVVEVGSVYSRDDFTGWTDESFYWKEVFSTCDENAAIKECNRWNSFPETP